MIATFSIRTSDIATIVYKVFKIIPKSTYDTRADHTELQEYIRAMYPNQSVDKKLYKYFLQQGLCKRDTIKIEDTSRKMLWIDRNKINQLFDIDITVKDDRSISTSLTSRSLFDDIRYYLDKNFDHYSGVFINTSRLQLHSQQDRHFTINNSGEMTYTPKGRLSEINSDRHWKKNGRQNIKYGKGLRKIFSYMPYMPEDHVIEKLQNHLRSRYEFTGTIKLVDGDDIKDWYYGSRYASNQGTLNDSCMRHGSCQDYFGIYTMNPEKVKMIIALNDDQQLIGRALVWHTDDDFFFCDRIYGRDITIEAIKTYAKNELSAYVKASQSYNDDTLVSTTGEIVNKHISVTLKNPLDYFPYMDTLKYTDCIDDDEITINNEHGDYTLTETDGGPNESNSITLHNGDRCHEDDARYVDRYDEYYHMDDVCYSDRLGEYIPDSEAVWVNEDDYMWQDSEEICYPMDEDGAMWVDDCTYSEYHEEYIYDAGECDVRGYVCACDLIDLEIGDNSFTIQRDVTIKDLLDAGLITEEEFEQQNATTNE